MKKYFIDINMKSDQLKRLALIIKQLKGNDNNRDFSKKLGISIYTISAWENEETRNPTTESLEILANYMGISLKELLSRIYADENNEAFNTAESLYSVVAKLPNKDKIKLAHFLLSEVVKE